MISAEEQECAINRDKPRFANDLEVLEFFEQKLYPVTAACSENKLRIWGLTRMARMAALRAMLYTGVAIADEEDSETVLAAWVDGIEDFEAEHKADEFTPQRIAAVHVLEHSPFDVREELSKTHNDMTELCGDIVAINFLAILIRDGIGACEADNIRDYAWNINKMYRRLFTGLSEGEGVEWMTRSTSVAELFEESNDE